MPTSVEAPAAVLEILSRSSTPVSFTVLVRQSRLSREILQRTLTAEGGKPGIFRWPDARGQQRFWSIAPEEFARRQVLEAASECALPAGLLVKQARKRAHGYPEKLVRSLVQQLIKDKELRKYSSFGRESSLIGRMGKPEAYAEAARRFIDEKVVAKVRAEGGSLGNAGRASLQPVSAPIGEGAADDILDAMHRLEASDSAPVSVRELRAALPSIDKHTFDEAALALRTKQKVFLSRHDYPQSLSVDDKALLIDGQNGSYYVAITARTE